MTSLATLARWIFFDIQRLCLDIGADTLAPLRHTLGVEVDKLHEDLSERINL